MVAEEDADQSQHLKRRLFLHLTGFLHVYDDVLAGEQLVCLVEVRMMLCGLVELAVGGC